MRYLEKAKVHCKGGKVQYRQHQHVKKKTLYLITDVCGSLGLFIGGKKEQNIKLILHTCRYNHTISNALCTHTHGNELLACIFLMKQMYLDSHHKIRVLYLFNDMIMTEFIELARFNQRQWWKPMFRFIMYYVKQTLDQKSRRQYRMKKQSESTLSLELSIYIIVNQITKIFYMDGFRIF